MQRTIRVFFVATLAVTGIAASFRRAHSATPASSPPSAPLAGAPSAPAAPGPGGKVVPTAGEPLIATAGPTGEYLRAVHGRLHGRWTQDFVKTVAATYPATHALNDPTRQATLALSIRWDGTISEAAIKRSSGSPEFDRAVMDIARKSAPFPLPVADVISDDSYAHLDWTFARDHRGCAAGAAIVRVDDPLEVSLPRLIMNNRIAEALRRVGEAATKGNPAGLDRFARLYLGRTVPDPLLDVAAAVALAGSGDQSQAPRLRLALASRPTADMAARGLQKLSIDVCDNLRAPLETGAATARDIALGAARSVAASGGDIGGCQPSLAAIVSDSHQASALRLQALDTLVTYLPAAGRPVVMAALDDKDPAVRGAALLASVSKGGGRRELYRLAPLLHDKAVEVRGAASAGMVRAAGDTALEQLYLLGRETDPRPGTWVAAELAQLSTPASAEFLGRMVRRGLPVVQVAAARALAGRKDQAARAELDAVKDDARIPGDARAIATGTAAAALAGHVPVSPMSGAAIAPARQLLKDNHHREAADWIIAQLVSLEPGDAIDVLGAWLARQPASASASAAPPAAPATSVSSSEATSEPGAAIATPSAAANPFPH